MVNKREETTNRGMDINARKTNVIKINGKKLTICVKKQNRNNIYV